MATEEVAVEGGDVDRRDVSASEEEVSVVGGDVEWHDVSASRLSPSSTVPNATPNAISVDIVDVDRYDVPAPCFAPVAAGGNTKSNAISVEEYMEDRDLHEAIVASLLQTGCQSLNKDDDVRVLDSVPAGTRSSSSRKRKKPYSGSSVTEPGEASNSKPDPSFICEICVETRTNSDLFRIKGCSHAYCKDCVTRYIASKLHDNVTRIGCPVSGCGGVLEPGCCRSILPPEVFDRWGNALCEALILEAEKFYCPFKDCSALLIKDGGEAVVRESECPNCRRLFCAQCRVPWHADVDCQEFQGLKEGEREREDIMLMKLAQNKRWRRCPNCSFYVEKIAGCGAVMCRSFYYAYI
ncbi:E3 ubiquitin-protein ligase RSL1-like isoform X2 [Rhodamnia argentea]|uniref:RBR-type E3 ubiquitin transferase n=1 Tax=Rhodamnia argentea TaxID=178133 RepID=A0ABM3H9C0_9MYRT|nr:E3 ubiquitin-protein ligase RSL1-like isoform X2 [Rhodamnia argentea]